jgi:uncharacterized protein Usg
MQQKIISAFLFLILHAAKTNTSFPKQYLSDTTKTTRQMKDSNSFTSTIVVDKDPATAFNAIKNFRAWWSEEIQGNSGELNEVFFYHYKDVHLCKIKMIEMIPDRKLVYQVLDNEFNFVKDQSEWINTKLIFEISPEGNNTKVKFTHEGLVPEHECYNICNEAWTKYIQESLYNLITSGKGQPNPKEGGFNAELLEKWVKS